MANGSCGRDELFALDPSATLPLLHTRRSKSARTINRRTAVELFWS
jgi:hypothetical protein